MIITIDTTAGPLSDADKAALRALVGDTSGVEVVKADRKAEQVEATKEAKKAAVKKAAPAPDPEPEAATEGGEDPLEDAVARATELVKEGKTPLVKKALAEVGVKRVSQLSVEHAEDFLAALDEG